MFLSHTVASSVFGPCHIIIILLYSRSERHHGSCDDRSSFIIVIAGLCVQEIMNDFYGRQWAFDVHNILIMAVQTTFTDDVIVKRLLYLLSYRLTNIALFDSSFSCFVLWDIDLKRPRRAVFRTLDSAQSDTQPILCISFKNLGRWYVMIIIIYKPTAAVGGNSKPL